MSDPAIRPAIRPGIRDARLPQDRAAIEAMFDGLQLVELDWDANRMPPGKCGAHVDHLLAWAAESGFVLMIDDDEGPCAMLIAGEVDEGGWVLPENRIRGDVSDLFVAPRARRQGLAWALLQEAERRFAARGRTRIEIRAVAQNAAARAMYRRWAGEPRVVAYERVLTAD